MKRSASNTSGKARETARFDAIKSPYTGEVVSEVAVASASDLDRAIESASRVLHACRALSAQSRASACEAVANALASQKDTIAKLIAEESGKPLRYARAEVLRGITTFALGAATARTLGGEVLPGTAAADGEGRLVLYRRVARGVVGAISPFNFPLNLAAHKLAPALAVGAPIVLKPPHQAPSAGLLLAELTAGLVPDGAVNALHALPEVAEQLARDERIALLSFTGSDSVGFKLKALAGKKQVLLELGGNAPCIVDETADLDDALPKIVESCWANAGQICIKAQRLIVHERIFEEFSARFLAATRELAVGDPLDERTVVGPLIEARHVARVLGLVEEARAAGARLLHGGQASGQLVEPTILVDVKPELRVYREEVFGPVTTLEPFRTFADALARANATRFGLQASLFTRDLGRALGAFERLEYGGVLINEPTTFRSDDYPYGGLRDSGSGREGVRFAAEEYTEPRVLVLRGVERT
jgi:acyl-CoA reductase-like NAD-dependent aldehyde dehydrogenase